MKRWGADLGCSFLALLAAGTEGFVTPFALRATSRVAAGGGRRQTAGSLSMIIPRPEWGYVCEELDEFPEYEPNMDVPGDWKPGSTPEAYPAEELPLDDFEHGGAFECEFHDLPSLERPCFMGMKAFIDQEGLALLPSEAEMLERDVQVERKRRAEARKERFADEPDEDLVDDTLDDVPLGTDIMATDASTPSVDFDENDAYDDGYEPVDIAGISGVEDAMY